MFNRYILGQMRGMISSEQLHCMGTTAKKYISNWQTSNVSPQKISKVIYIYQIVGFNHSRDRHTPKCHTVHHKYTIMIFEFKK
jgi:hypothetical protein